MLCNFTFNLSFRRLKDYFVPKMEVKAFLLNLLLVRFFGARGQNRNIITINAANLSVIRDNINHLRIANFKKITNKYLNGTAMKKLCVKDSLKCAEECITVDKCASFNFGKTQNCSGEHECSILHEDLLGSLAKTLSSGPYDYFSVNVSIKNIYIVL